MKLHPILLAGLLILPAHAFAQTVTIGVPTQYDVGEFTVEASVLQGFEKALTDAACERGKLACEWKEMASDALVPALMAKEIDVMMAAIPSSAELGENVDVTAPYVYPDLFSVVGAPGTNVHGDVTTVATIDDPAIDAWAKTNAFNFKKFPTLEEALQEVERGGAEVAMGEQEHALPLVEKFNGQAIVDSRRLRAGLVMALHADSIDLRFNFEDRIYEMSQDGSLNGLIEEWFGVDADRW